MKICEETAPGAARARARNDTAEVFESHRPRLFRLAYRMLGSRCDAEDLVQDAYLRWHQSATQDIQSPAAFLVTITTRLCVDRLLKLKQEREHYVGRWLPEPIVEDLIPSPEMQLELADEVSIAFLAVLERLGPEERAAFLLHEIVDYDYPEVAQMLGKTEPACRQMIHRARIRVRESRPRFSITTESRERVLGKFLTAVGTGDRKAVMALLAEEVEYTAAGGGKVVAALNVPEPGESRASVLPSLSGVSAPRAHPTPGGHAEDLQGRRARAARHEQEQINEDLLAFIKSGGDRVDAEPVDAAHAA